MALNKQNVFLSFAKGVDNSLDPKLVIPSKFTRLDNLEFDTVNTVRQRPGFTRQTITAHTNSPAVANVRRLMALGEEVLLEADSGLHGFLQDHTVSRDECGGGSIGSRIKTFERAQIDYIDVAASQRDQYGIDVCIATQSRLECWVWTEIPLATPTLQNVFYRVVDSVTRAIVQEGNVGDFPTVNSYFNPRIVERYVSGGTSRFYIYFVEYDGVDYKLKLKSLDIANNAKVTGALSAASAPPLDGGGKLTATGVFDVVFDLTNDYLCLIYTETNDVYISTYLASNGTTGVDSQNTAHPAARAVSISLLTSGGVRYAIGVYQINTNVIYSASLGLTGGPALTDASIATPTSPGRVSSMTSPFNAAQVLAFYDFNPYSAGEVFTHDIGFVAVAAGGAAVAGTESTFARSVVLAARPVVYFSSAGLADICVTAALLSDLQPTLFALKFGGAAKAANPGFDNSNGYTSPRVLARIFPGECGSLKAKYANNLRIPTCLGGYTTSVKIPFTKKGKPQFEGGIDVTPSRATLGTLSFSLSLPSFEAQRSLFMTGACPMEYDGSIVHEAGFHHYPEGITGTPSNGAGALEVSATYGGIFVYEWENAKGVLCRSAASVPVSVVTGAADDTITWTFPYLRLTDKMGVDDGASEHRQNVRIVLYRTVKNGTIYYRETAPTTGQGCINRTSLTTVGNWISIQSDASLISGELLYTTGGALDNEAFPSTSIACLHQNRIFSVTQEEQSWLQYTDEIDERFLSPGTSEIYRLRVPPEAGKVVGLASMDEKLIVVCEKQVGYFFGEGPNRLGQQNGYSSFQIASSTLGGLAGCQESLVVTPDGTFFMSSSNGLRMLTRGMTIAMKPDDPDAFFGSESDADFVATYSSIKGLSIKSKSQIRWFLGGTSTVIIYNFEQHQWSKFTGVNSNGGATVARSVFYHSDATLLQAHNTAAGGLDDATTTTQVLESAWINLADKQGFQRVYSLMILGRAQSACTVGVEIGYDYDEDTYATVANYAVGAASNPLQIEHPLPKQQCEAIRFRLTITPGSSAEAVRLTNFGFSIGLKKGLFKLPSSKRF